MAAGGLELGSQESGTGSCAHSLSDIPNLAYVFGAIKNPKGTLQVHCQEWRMQRIEHSQAGVASGLTNMGREAADEQRHLSHSTQGNDGFLRTAL